jgi:hypothetical protein
MSKQQFTSASCPSCDTLFDRLPVDFDDEGTGYAAMEVTPCADPECGQLLCTCCAQFACDGCGETFCSSHLVAVPDGTPQPLHCCPACALECEEVPARIPAQRELVAASTKSEVA